MSPQASTSPALYERNWAPVRVAWTAPTHPRPQVPAREPLESEMPRTAAKLLQQAQAAGWAAQARYARGTSTDSQGNATRIVDSLTVKAFRDGVTILAIWIDGKFSSAWTWGAKGLHPLKARDVKSLVEE